MDWLRFSLFGGDGYSEVCDWQKTGLYKQSSLNSVEKWYGLLQNMDDEFIGPFKIRGYMN